MRLITKTTLFYLFISLLVFSIAGIITYKMVMKEVAKEMDYSLRNNMILLENAIREGKPLDALQNSKTQITKVTDFLPEDTLYVFSDTLAIHPYFKRLEPHRKLAVTRKINNEYYRFIMVDLFFESHEVSDGVIQVMTRLFLGLGLALLMCSFLISSLLLRPFQQTLQKIKDFNLKDGKTLLLPNTSTREFTQLNRFISHMTAKARRDYISLKEFSENAAHEMQTPIAIAKGKLELLLESPDLTEGQLPLIQSAQSSLSKLSKLGQSLSLLTKIENHEFKSQEITNFSEIVEQAVANFKDICELKKLQLDSKIKKGIHLPINAALADILVANLLKNAVRYNLPNGWIKIEVDKDKLQIQNPGVPPQIPPQQLFERFRKDNQSGQSLGLGLAIVKKICEVSKFKISYEFEANIHLLTVVFK